MDGCRVGEERKTEAGDLTCSDYCGANCIVYTGAWNLF